MSWRVDIPLNKVIKIIDYWQALFHYSNFFLCGIYKVKEAHNAEALVEIFYPFHPFPMVQTACSMHSLQCSMVNAKRPVYSVQSVQCARWQDT